MFFIAGLNTFMLNGLTINGPSDGLLLLMQKTLNIDQELK